MLLIDDLPRLEGRFRPEDREGTMLERDFESKVVTILGFLEDIFRYFHLQPNLHGCESGHIFEIIDGESGINVDSAQNHSVSPLEHCYYTTFIAPIARLPALLEPPKTSPGHPIHARLDQARQVTPESVENLAWSELLLRIQRVVQVGVEIRRGSEAADDQEAELLEQPMDGAHSHTPNDQELMFSM
jgi:hypothetical protein